MPGIQTRTDYRGILHKEKKAEISDLKTDLKEITNPMRAIFEDIEYHKGEVDLCEKDYEDYMILRSFMGVR